MKKVIASFSFTLSIIILLVIGIISTETMLKADNNYNSLKGMGYIGLTRASNISDGHTNDIIKKVYLGRYQNQTCYAFETVDTYNGSNVSNDDSIEINFVVIVSKYSGKIVDYKISGKNTVTNKDMVHSNGMNDYFTEEHLKLIGTNGSSELNLIEGATITINSLKKCLDSVFEMYEILKIEDNPDLQISSTLKSIGVTDSEKFDHTIISVSNKIRNIYTGKFEEKEVYVFDGIAPNQYENAQNHEINLLIVIDKETGVVLKTQVVGSFTYGEGYNISANDFNMNNSDNINSFVAVTNATKSSESVKEIFTAVFAAYNKIRGTK